MNYHQYHILRSFVTIIIEANCLDCNKTGGRNPETCECQMMVRSFVIVIVVDIEIHRRERIQIARRANSAVKTSKEWLSRAEKGVRFASVRIHISFFSTV